MPFSTKQILGGVFIEQKDFLFIQNQIGYNFQNTDLLQQAFVRRSYSKEYGCFISDYEDFNPDEEFDEFACINDEAKLTELKKKLV